MTRHHTEILSTTSPTKQTSEQFSHATRLNKTFVQVVRNRGTLQEKKIEIKN